MLRLLGLEDTDPFVIWILWFAFVAGILLFLRYKKQQAELKSYRRGVVGRSHVYGKGDVSGVGVGDFGGGDGGGDGGD